MGSLQIRGRLVRELVTRLLRYSAIALCLAPVGTLGLSAHKVDGQPARSTAATKILRRSLKVVPILDESDTQSPGGEWRRPTKCTAGCWRRSRPV